MMGGENIFISYKEDNEKSAEIALELREFFKRWGQDCELVAYSISNSPPKNEIRDKIKSSKYMLQLLTTDRKISDWMQWERDTFETVLSYDDNDPTTFGKRFKVLHTAETDFNSEEFSDIRALAKEGLLSLIPIDNEIKAQKLFKSIIFNDLSFKSTGEICLPECCKPKASSKIHKKKLGPDRFRIDDAYKYLKNFRIANSKGLKSVHPDNNSARNQIIEKIQQLKTGESVSLVGFTLHRYTHPDRTVGSEFVKAIKDRGAKAKLLLINRNCRAADERMRIESSEEYYTNKEHAILFDDNVKVETYYRNNNFFNGQVELKFYSTPYSGVVIFEDLIFVEIYHLGDDEENLVDDNENLEPINTICGRVPVLVIEKGSPFYRIFSSHFDQLWDSASITIDTCKE